MRVDGRVVPPGEEAVGVVKGLTSVVLLEEGVEERVVHRLVSSDLLPTAPPGGLYSARCRWWMEAEAVVILIV